MLFTKCNPNTVPMFVHDNLQWYVEGGGLPKVVIY